MTRSAIFLMLLLNQWVLLAAGSSNNTIAAPDSIFESTNGMNLGGCITAVVAVLVGGGMAIFGYRFLYETVFAIGFSVGAVSVAIIAERMFIYKSYMVIGSWLAFIFSGILCGSLAMWVHPKSSFLAGVAGGIILAAIVTNSTAYYVFPGQTGDFFTLLCVIFGVVFAAFDLKYGKPMEIISTSIFGAAMLVWGVGYFVGDFPFPNNLEIYAKANTNGDLEYSIPTVWWGYLGGMVVVSTFGMLLQFRKTGRKAIDDEFAGFEPHEFGYPIDAVPYVENDKQRSDLPVLEQTTRESDYLPTSYPSATHESFCRLYTRNTEAQSISKMRLKFLEDRAQSFETKTALDGNTSLQPPNSSRGVKKEKLEAEF